MCNDTEKLPTVCSVGTMTTNQNTNLYTHCDALLLKVGLFVHKNDWKYDPKMLIMVLPNGLIAADLIFLCKSV